MMSGCVLKIAFYWTPLTPHGSRFSSVYAMVACACGLFLTILVQHLLLLCFGDRDNQYLVQAINLFNILVLPSDAISVESVLSSPIKQRTLSHKLDNRLFQILLSLPQLLTRPVFCLSQPLTLLPGCLWYHLLHLASTRNLMSSW